MMGRKIWNPDELEYLKDTYAFTPADILARRFSVSILSIYSQAGKLKLKKSPEFLLQQKKRLGKQLAESQKSISHRFNKGHIPANKGKKTSQEVRKKIEHTFFQKGNLPKNTLYDGAITIRRDKTGRYYKWIRISKQSWKMLQIYNWEIKNGPMPKDKILVSKDGNSLNCDPENWMIIDRKTHLERNSGRVELTDKYIKNILALRNKELRIQISQSPEIINLKRSQIKLRRTINECH